MERRNRTLTSRFGDGSSTIKLFPHVRNSSVSLRNLYCTKPSTSFKNFNDKWFLDHHLTLIHAIEHYISIQSNIGKILPRLCLLWSGHIVVSTNLPCKMFPRNPIHQLKVPRDNTLF